MPLVRNVSNGYIISDWNCIWFLQCDVRLCIGVLRRHKIFYLDSGKVRVRVVIMVEVSVGLALLIF